MNWSRVLGRLLGLDQITRERARWAIWVEHAFEACTAGGLAKGLQFLERGRPLILACQNVCPDESMRRFERRVVRGVLTSEFGSGPVRVSTHGEKERLHRDQPNFDRWLCWPRDVADGVLCCAELVELQLAGGKRLVSKNRLSRRQALPVYAQEPCSGLLPKGCLGQGARGHEHEGDVAIGIAPFRAIEQSSERSERSGLCIFFGESLAQDGEAANLSHPASRAQ